MRLKLRIAVLAALLSMLGTLVAPGTVASATEHCPSPGGSDLPFDVDLAQIDGEDDVAITGGGWGHGVGMSQYGAQGAARLGCTHPQILEAYYRGVDVEQMAMPETVRIGFLDPGSQTTKGGVATITNQGETAVPWELQGCDHPDDAERCTPPDDLPAGATWEVHSDAAGMYHVTDADDTEVWSGGDHESLLIAQHDGTVITVDVPGLKRTVRWGATELDSYAEAAEDGNGKLFVVQVIDAEGDHSAMERYLWGLAEVPSSWPVESLRAQAVAARSYARIRTDSVRAGCRCNL